MRGNWGHGCAWSSKREEPRQEQSYSGAELSEIIRRAARRPNSTVNSRMTMDEIAAVGAELGIERGAIEQAAEEVIRMRRRARRMEHQKTGFLSHFSVYLSVIGGLFLINAITNWGDWWFLFPAIGWGIGLACHFSSVWVKQRALTAMESA